MKIYFQTCGYSYPTRDEVSELLLSGAGPSLHPCSTEGMVTAQTLKAVQPCLKGHVLGFITLISQGEHTISIPRPLLFLREPLLILGKQVCSHVEVHLHSYFPGCKPTHRPSDHMQIASTKGSPLIFSYPAVKNVSAAGTVTLSSVSHLCRGALSLSFLRWIGLKE